MVDSTCLGVWLGEVEAGSEPGKHQISHEESAQDEGDVGCSAGENSGFEVTRINCWRRALERQLEEGNKLECISDTVSHQDRQYLFSKRL